MASIFSSNNDESCSLCSSTFVNQNGLSFKLKVKLLNTVHIMKSNIINISDLQKNSNYETVKKHGLDSLSSSHLEERNGFVKTMTMDP